MGRPNSASSLAPAPHGSQSHVIYNIGGHSLWRGPHDTLLIFSGHHGVGISLVWRSLLHGGKIIGWEWLEGCEKWKWKVVGM